MQKIWREPTPLGVNNIQDKSSIKGRSDVYEKEFDSPGEEDLKEGKPDSPSEDLSDSSSEEENLEPTKRRKKAFIVAKIIFLITNSLVFVASITVFGVATWVLSSPGYARKLHGFQHYPKSCFVLITAGLATTAASVLGFYGAIKESKLVASGYFIAIFLLFFLMFIGGVIAYVCRGTLADGMYSEMHKSIALYGQYVNITHAWDDVQKVFKCCGMITVNDTISWHAWRKLNPKIFNLNFQVPTSCCIKEGEESLIACGSQPSNRSIYMKDCFLELNNYMEQQIYDLGAVGVGLSFVLVLSMTFTCVFLLVHR